MMTTQKKQFSSRQVHNDAEEVVSAMTTAVEVGTGAEPAADVMAPAVAATAVVVVDCHNNTAMVMVRKTW